MEAFEINEIANAEMGVQQHLRIASSMIKVQPRIATTNIGIAISILKRTLKRLEQLGETT